MCFNEGRASAGDRLSKCFSPLFIGACVSTGSGLAQGRLDPTFQSPLHRGMCFNESEKAVKAVPAKSFSPLYIGACVSTVIDEFERRMIAQFQSPLHRGMCFNNTLPYRRRYP